MGRAQTFLFFSDSLWSLGLSRGASALPSLPFCLCLEENSSHFRQLLPGKIFPTFLACTTSMSHLHVLPPTPLKVTRLVCRSCEETEWIKSRGEKLQKGSKISTSLTHCLTGINGDFSSTIFTVPQIGLRLAFASQFSPILLSPIQNKRLFLITASQRAKGDPGSNRILSPHPPTGGGDAGLESGDAVVGLPADACMEQPPLKQGQTIKCALLQGGIYLILTRRHELVCLFV